MPKNYKMTITDEDGNIILENDLKVDDISNFRNRFALYNKEISFLMNENENLLRENGYEPPAKNYTIPTSKANDRICYPKDYIRRRKEFDRMYHISEIFGEDEAKIYTVVIHLQMSDWFNYIINRTNTFKNINDILFKYAFINIVSVIEAMLQEGVHRCYSQCRFHDESSCEMCEIAGKNACIKSTCAKTLCMKHEDCKGYFVVGKEARLNMKQILDRSLYKNGKPKKNNVIDILGYDDISIEDLMVQEGMSGLESLEDISNMTDLLNYLYEMRNKVHILSADSLQYIEEKQNLKKQGKNQELNEQYRRNTNLYNIAIHCLRIVNRDVLEKLVPCYNKCRLEDMAHNE